MNLDLQSLLKHLSLRENLPSSDRILACIEDSQDLAVHGEEVLAFENLCQNLFEWDFPLTKDELSDIEQLGLHYRLPESTWSFLRKLLDSKLQNHSEEA